MNARRIAQAARGRPGPSVLRDGVFLEAVTEVDHRVRRRIRAALEDRPRRRVRAVDRFVGLVVDPQPRSVERHAGEQAAGARIAVDLRPELLVGAGLRAAADRTGRDARVAAERELAVDDVLDAARAAE